MERIIYNVVHKNDEWRVMKAQNDVCEGRFRQKQDAVDWGRFLAMREEVGELRILKLDGSIQSEFLFGKNPLEVEG